MTFQENFDNITEKVTGVAQAAAQKAKDAALIGRLKVQIFTEQDKIRRAENELGKLCYRDYQAGVDADKNEYAPVLAKITAANDSIDELRSIIDAVKNSGAAEEEPVAEAPVSEEEETEADFVE